MESLGYIGLLHGFYKVYRPSMSPQNGNYPPENVLDSNSRPTSNAHLVVEGFPALLEESVLVHGFRVWDSGYPAWLGA